MLYLIATLPLLFVSGCNGTVGILKFHIHLLCFSAGKLLVEMASNNVQVCPLNAYYSNLIIKAGMICIYPDSILSQYLYCNIMIYPIFGNALYLCPCKHYLIGNKTLISPYKMSLCLLTLLYADLPVNDLLTLISHCSFFR